MWSGKNQICTLKQEQKYCAKAETEASYAKVNGFKVLSADADAAYNHAKAEAYANPTSASASASARVGEANASAGLIKVPA